MMNKQNKLDIMYSSQTDVWGTPKTLFDLLNEEFSFTLDVCANELNAKCTRYFNEKDDGLSQNWDGDICWMNPPYGRKIAQWIRKASESKGLVVALIPSRTDTFYWHKYVMHSKEVRFIQGRVKFEGTGSLNAAPFPSCVVVFDGRDYPVPEISTMILDK